MKKTITDIYVNEKKVLVRSDLNVPIDNGVITDDSRIRASVPTIRDLLDRKAAVVICSHLGRPGGKVIESLRLDSVAERLGELLGTHVRKLDDCIGQKVRQAVDELRPGQALMLENLRFHKEEKQNDSAFAAELAKLADIFVNDAFASAHRAHASTAGITEHLPSVAGLLMEHEMAMLRPLREGTHSPMVVILGGAKVSDKIEAARYFASRADAVLVGGALANTFLRARGTKIGDSMHDSDELAAAVRILSLPGDRIILPRDVVVANTLSADANYRTVGVEGVPTGYRIVDIGTETIDLFKKHLNNAASVAWSGPLGAFEIAPFAEGTIRIASHLAELTNLKVVGGGETVAAIGRDFEGSGLQICK
jgi:phosphoglycerate kinase